MSHFPDNNVILHISHAARHRLVNALVAVHDAGVRFGHMTMENIIVGPRDAVFLVNFEYACAHICYNRFDIVFHTHQPHPERHDCRELWTICQALDIWIPRK